MVVDLNVREQQNEADVQTQTSPDSVDLIIFGIEREDFLSESTCH